MPKPRLSPRPRTISSLVDFAKHLDLSVWTVSRAINGHPEVKEETRSRVLAAMEEVGYRPNPLARGLGRGRTGMVGVCSIGYAVLGASFLFESLSFRVAYREFRAMTGGKPIVRAILEARDPTVPLVLVEDTTALVGLAIALAAVALRSITGAAFWDALGCLLIGVLLAVAAAMLASVTHGLLIGKSASAVDEGIAIQLTETTPGVTLVTQVLSLHLGPDVVVLSMKVAFSPATTAVEIEAITNQIELRIRAAMPRMRKIFIEVDAHGDGRGVEAARAAALADASFRQP